MALASSPTGHARGEGLGEKGTGKNRQKQRDEGIMHPLKEQRMRWIDEDRDQIIRFLCDFVRAKSPNPPGDTTLAAAHVASFLETHQLPFRVIAPQPTMPNIVGSFAGTTP